MGALYVQTIRSFSCTSERALWENVLSSGVLLEISGVEWWFRASSDLKLLTPQDTGVFVGVSGSHGLGCGVCSTGLVGTEVDG